MTRMWMLPTGELCDQHLVGEHAELHQLAGTLINHEHGAAIVEGHADKGNVDTSRIEDRHAVLVAELDRRGYEHDSPLPEFDAPDVGSIDVAANRRDLRERCDDCAARMAAEVPN